MNGRAAHAYDAFTPMRILLWLGSLSLVPLGAPSARPPAQADCERAFAGCAPGPVASAPPTSIQR